MVALSLTKKRLATVRHLAILVAVLFLTLWCISFFRSFSLYQSGKKALLEGRILAAITSFERSGLYYAPLNPFYKKSIQELLSIEKKEALQNTLFPLQAGNAARRVLNQISPWGDVAQNKKNTRRFFPQNSIFVYTLTHLSFMGWLSFTTLFFFRGFDEAGKLQLSAAKSTAIKALLSLGIWFLLIRFF